MNRLSVVAVVFVMNGLFILALIASFVWVGLAIGNDDEFQSRWSVCLILQITCIASMFVRRALREVSHD
jgi:hypothetical protein